MKASRVSREQYLYAYVKLAANFLLRVQTKEYTSERIRTVRNLAKHQLEIMTTIALCQRYLGPKFIKVYDLIKNQKIELVKAENYLLTGYKIYATADASLL